MSRLPMVSNKIDLIFYISLFVFYYVENLKPKGDLYIFSLKKSSIYYDYAEKHGDTLKQTLVDW